ncbi:unnamed protein product [Orchesella dallaii]|uniref:ABC transporter domain-containing protein n=1 Tax=Orchesella dallaii TaxID=48710 RepID=A0ABP1RYZ5_9HEXA
MFKKILILLWKNLLLRKRHWIITTLELFLPVLLLALLVYVNSQYMRDWNIGEAVYKTNSTIFDALNENNLTKNNNIFNPRSKHYFNLAIPYAPENKKTKQVIQKLEDCLDVNPTINIKWEPFESEEAIENFFAKPIEISYPPSNVSVRAAIVFQEGLGIGDESNDDNTVAYKIRLHDIYLPDVHQLFPIAQRLDPDEYAGKLYSDTGFIALQLCLDKVLVETLTMKNVTRQISLQPFPYPPYHEFKYAEEYETMYLILLPFVFVISFVLMVPSVMRAVVSEKETGIRELLKLNGLASWMQWMGWMLNSMLGLVITVTIMVILLYIKIGSVAIFESSDPTVWWFVLMLYVMSATSFCFCISSIFTKPSLAITVGIILWFVTFVSPYAQLVKNHWMSDMSFALFPNMALTMAIWVISSFEAKGSGMQWSSIGVPHNEDDFLCLGHIILMFLVDTFLYMFLTIYLENVLPSKYGDRKPFYYIFLPGTYLKIKVKNSDIGMEEICTYSSPGFEGQTATGTVGVDIQNLRKTFGTESVAVDGINLRMYNGEIFVLLGQNGAGKTTTISMLTGMFPPTSGTAIINGYDITKDLERATDNVGVCTQHNLLFDKLTVSEHLRFFGQLRGLTVAEADSEANQLLQKLQFTDKQHSLSMELSGGQKRKLSLGIALIGGPQVVILDEPTSGMDPEARRAVWDLLLEMRGQRTILLTTHFMEEADVLGDRIGIMASGKLQCCGSSMFLKKFYGTGYTLKVSVADDFNAYSDTVLSVIQTHIPTATLKTVHTRTSEIMISLPSETATTSILSIMFKDLTQQKEHLKIKTIGLSLTTMDEVFLRVGELTEDRNNHDSDDSDDESPTNQFIKAEENTGREKLVGWKLVLEQFIALLIKKSTYSYRNWKLMIPQLIIPVVLVILAILACNALSRVDPPSPSPSFKFTLDSYNKNTLTLVSSTDSNISKYFSEVIGSSYKQAPVDEPLVQTLLDVSDKNVADYMANYIVAFEANSSHLKAMYSTIPSHAAPLAINLASNVILKSLDPTKDLKIQVSTHRLDRKIFYSIDGHLDLGPASAELIPLVFGIFMSIGLAMLTASFVVFPIQENICNAKQLQMMTGVSPLLYWGSTFIWDFVLMFLVIGAMTLCFPIFQTSAIFTSHDGAGVAFLILLVYGLSAIPFSYLVSLHASTVAGGFSFISIVHILSGVVMCAIRLTFEGADTFEFQSFAMLRCIGWLFPSFGVVMSWIVFAEIAIYNRHCHTLSDEAKILLCNPSSSAHQYFQKCCANCHELPNVTCFEPLPYITWNSELGSQVPGIGQEILAMVIISIVYQTILMLLEYHVLQRFFKKEGCVFEDNVGDEDVKAEADRVAGMVGSDRMDEDALVVSNLSKRFGSFAAVSRLNFGMHHGECFGLLGVNGAGKTTAFRMLTGDETSSSGNAYSLRKTLDKNRHEFLSNIGYCPQFDGIIGILSGREMVQLFGRLRGIPERFRKGEGDKWLERMGLLESADMQCQKYSGGMKRRLSAAMAMIGDPALLLLDEPVCTKISYIRIHLRQVALTQCHGVDFGTF